MLIYWDLEFYYFENLTKSNGKFILCLLAIGTSLKLASVSFLIILHVLLSVGQADEWNDT